jgi:secondary thiamine-phosphate synthase enzyme
VREIALRTTRRTQLVDITEQVQSAVEGSNGAAAALIYVPHTTAGVTVNERADPMVARDFENALERIVDDGWNWKHIELGEENAPSHIRASLMSPQVLVPLDNDGLALGTWQGVFFCEFDGPRDRKIYVTTLA